MLRNLCLAVILTITAMFASAQNFPKLGNDTLLDVACWNVEWLGDVSNGPSDETTQYTNVKAMLQRTDMDVFALEEISNMSTYNTLTTDLSSVYSTYISTFSQTQKTGLFWKKSMFEVIGVQTLNISLSSSDNYAFASRPPLQVCLQTKGGTRTDTIYFLVLHMKAQSGSTDSESYNRRKNASIALKTYIESTLAGKKFIVLGDWNDDLDVSIYAGQETPYKNLLTAGYQFPSKELTDSGKASYAFASNMIDHMLISKSLDSFYYKNSARVFDNAAVYCDNFSTNTSDHFPVYASYNWKKLTTRIIPEGVGELSVENHFRIYPNPSGVMFQIECDKEPGAYKVIASDGKLVLEGNITGLSGSVNLSEFPQGVYWLITETGFSCRLIRQ